MIVSEMREAVRNYIDHVDEVTLRMIHAMLKEYSAPREPSDELYEELERRSKAYKTGKMKTYTVEEAMVRLRKRIKGKQ
jgi:putative addiction module component (TIGR02574 family)